MPPQFGVTVKCPICVSILVTIEAVSDTSLTYRCEACGARFQIEYPLPTNATVKTAWQQRFPSRGESRSRF
jgi:hypothetical protein